MEYIYIEVESNDNTPMSANQVYRSLEDPFPVKAVRIYDGEPGGRMYDVTAWTSRTHDNKAQAYAARVEDSSEGHAYVVFGGDWGVRLRPEGSTNPWALEDMDQMGETHLVLSEAEDIVRGGTNF